MRKTQLLQTVAFGHSNLLAPTALERSRGRLMRASAPPGDGGAGGGGTQGGGQQGGSGGTQGSGGTNTGGNNGQNGGGDSGGGNNTGGAFDADSFWQSPGPSGNGSPNPQGSGSDGTNPGGSGTGGDDNQQYGQQLGQQIGQFNPGVAMTAETLQQIAEGNPQGFNDALVNAQRSTLQQGLQMTVGIMQIMAEMDRRMSTRETNRDNTAALETAIPIAKQPGMQPIVNAVFAQALTRSGGDRTKAIAMTKQMMQNMHGNMQGDGTGLDIPPANSGSSGRDQTQSPINWLESLTTART